jgi:hypothetical protein
MTIASASAPYPCAPIFILRVRGGSTKLSIVP